MKIEILKENKGFSLIELMTAVGISSIVIFAVMSNMNLLNKVVSNTESQVERKGILSQLLSTISDPQQCTQNFFKMKLSSGSFNEMKIFSGHYFTTKSSSILKVNKKYKNIKISQISYKLAYKDPTNQIAEINIELKINNTKSGKSYSHFFPIYVTYRYDNLSLQDIIIGCSEVSNQQDIMANSCSKIGGVLTDIIPSSQYYISPYDKTAIDLRYCYHKSGLSLQNTISKLNNDLCHSESIAFLTTKPLLNCSTNCVKNYNSKVNYCYNEIVPNSCGYSDSSPVMGLLNGLKCSLPSSGTCASKSTICNGSLMPQNNLNQSCPGGLGTSTSLSCAQITCSCPSSTSICSGYTFYDNCGSVCGTGTKPPTYAIWGPWGEFASCDNNCKEFRFCNPQNVDCTSNLNCNNPNATVDSKTCRLGNCPCHCPDPSSICSGQTATAEIGGPSSLCNQSCNVVGTKPIRNAKWSNWLDPGMQTCDPSLNTRILTRTCDTSVVQCNGQVTCQPDIDGMQLSKEITCL